MDKWANSLQHLCNDVVSNTVFNRSPMTFDIFNDRFSQWARASVVALITFYSSFAHAAAFTAEQLFESDRLIEVEITMPPSNWEALRNESDRESDSTFSARASTAARAASARGSSRFSAASCLTSAARASGVEPSLFVALGFACASSSKDEHSTCPRLHAQ